MGMELSADALDYFFLRLFELGGQSDVNQFDYRKIIDEWGRDDDRSKFISLLQKIKNKQNNKASKMYLGSNNNISTTEIDLIMINDYNFYNSKSIWQSKNKN